uniref:Uncharacterized protein n=1 Tax=Chromera velia CCMP2878 TaxID=1169474 RepID=A0A0G4GN86_9ALVE|eukprot:Cvel_22645.t1-p1 / transcript=Cvel_22645.t1 / gene=Cvel_22645 / organism=Chromera_velia_CCMP2878 / gene_product=hypothetical protein / transcript_product=hypothetical protein / location=Cvel_scaffold2247:18894-25117(-) / protein_length=811 / sequence_SO=supercontig / SO=protein_coding / is_pseudo=false
MEAAQQESPGIHELLDDDSMRCIFKYACTSNDIGSLLKVDSRLNRLIALDSSVGERVCRETFGVSALPGEFEWEKGGREEEKGGERSEEQEREGRDLVQENLEKNVRAEEGAGGREESMLKSRVGIWEKIGARQRVRERMVCTSPVVVNRKAADTGREKERRYGPLSIHRIVTGACSSTVLRTIPLDSSSFQFSLGGNSNRGKRSEGPEKGGGNLMGGGRLVLFGGSDAVVSGVWLGRNHPPHSVSGRGNGRAGGASRGREGGVGEGEGGDWLFHRKFEPALKVTALDAKWDELNGELTMVAGTSSPCAVFVSRVGLLRRPDACFCQTDGASLEDSQDLGSHRNASASLPPLWQSTEENENGEAEGGGEAVEGRGRGVSHYSSLGGFEVERKKCVGMARLSSMRDLLRGRMEAVSIVDKSSACLAWGTTVELLDLQAERAVCQMRMKDRVRSLAGLPTSGCPLSGSPRTILCSSGDSVSVFDFRQGGSSGEQAGAGSRRVERMGDGGGEVMAVSLAEWTYAAACGDDAVVAVGDLRRLSCKGGGASCSSSSLGGSSSSYASSSNWGSPGSLSLPPVPLADPDVITTGEPFFSSSCSSSPSSSSSTSASSSGSPSSSCASSSSVVHLLRDPGAASFDVVSLCPLSGRVAAGGSGPFVTLWDLKSGRLLSRGEVGRRGGRSRGEGGQTDGGCSLLRPVCADTTLYAPHSPSDSSRSPRRRSSSSSASVWGSGEREFGIGSLYQIGQQAQAGGRGTAGGRENDRYGQNTGRESEWGSAIRSSEHPDISSVEMSPGFLSVATSLGEATLLDFAGS